MVQPLAIGDRSSSFVKCSTEAVTALCNKLGRLSIETFFQWTYQAMIHELIGIRNNTVDLTGRPGVNVIKLFSFVTDDKAQ